MWCPKCGKETPCAAIALYPHNRKPSQRKAIKCFAEIHFFERLRRCTICGEEFETVELPNDYLYELMKLRELIRKLRDRADVIAKQARSIKADADALVKWQLPG